MGSGIISSIILRFKSDTWIQIRDNEQNIIISKLMKKKEEFILTGGTKYFITTGNAGNIEIYGNQIFTILNLLSFIQNTPTNMQLQVTKPL